MVVHFDVESLVLGITLGNEFMISCIIMLLGTFLFTQRGSTFVIEYMYLHLCIVEVYVMDEITHYFKLIFVLG